MEVFRHAAGWVPSASALPEDAWRVRHRVVVTVLALHAVGLALFGLWTGQSVLHVALEGGAIALFALGAASTALPSRVRSAIGSAGLVSASGVLVHFSGGYIEAHFHFFVMLGLIALYEDWVPYALAVSFVALHHGVVGTYDPMSVYNHPDAILHPWRWAIIHATFIAGLSAALLVTWRVAHEARLSAASAALETQNARAELAASEKLSALGTLVAGVAHEIRTPLTYVSNNVYVAKRRVDDPAVVAALDDAIEGVDRINRLVAGLRRFHEPRSRALEDIPLDVAVRGGVDLFLATHRGGVRVVPDLQPTPVLGLNRIQVQQLVLNLLTNAAEATGGKGTVRVATSAGERWAELVIEDDGPGMPPQVQVRMFEPFYTTKPEGTGLGLAIVQRIVDEHGGSVTCDTAPGRGARFRIVFPVARASPVQAVADLATAPAA